ncbi:hypothetical protein SUGI_0654180 [Cryptomeria japonica]|uniref:RING-H2 finger protein ATL43-like n=1 Tax=Cryptomeria japonica TaxID=3369 RepID=UPI002414AA45|nr:RING-H2 finger protein ATL43-like [Cryptomeria japonica]GLJ32509.1 hypothetical protein SUGI_0654180 [Cryptomeria japonica]
MDEALIQAVACIVILFGVILPTSLITAFCLRGNTSFTRVTHDQELGWAQGDPSNVHYEGLERHVLEGLPVFEYKSQEGHQCAVCLSDYGDSEIVKPLPNCNHYFHKECIDVWLRSYTSCPVCRTRVQPNILSCLLDKEKDRERDGSLQEQPISSDLCSDVVEGQVVVSKVDQGTSGARPLPQIAIPLANA